MPATQKTLSYFDFVHALKDSNDPLKGTIWQGKSGPDRTLLGVGSLGDVHYSFIAKDSTMQAKWCWRGTFYSWARVGPIHPESKE